MSEADRLAAQGLEALRRGDPAAVDLLGRALDLDPDHARLLIAHAEAAVAASTTEPLRRLERAVAAAPGWVEGQAALASLRFELDGPGGFAASYEQALQRNPADAALWNGYFAALVGAGQMLEAADAARAARSHFDVPILKLIESNHAGAAGEIARADALLTEVADDDPEKAPVAARHCIRIGDYERALRLLDELRARDPQDLSAWALTELLWRKTGHARAEWLSLRPGLVAAIPLSLDAAEIDGLVALLRQLHQLRGRPLGQSARGGTQTRGALFERQDAPIGRLRDRIQEALDEYRAALPAADSAHPLLAHREHRWVASGGWSIRLTDAGFHVPHLHPSGLVSSACHLIVPPVDRASGEGSLELGRPPDDLLLELEPIVSVAPVPGTLILFPSFLYHGTRPFAAGERLSVAFDAR